MLVILIQTMSKQFFSILGNELCSFRNSPFTRLGQPDKIQIGIIKSQLSYNPSRLFDKQKFADQLKGIQSKQFIQIKEAEREEYQKIQYQMLAEATLEDFQRKVKQINRQMDERTARKQFSIFKTKRGICISDPKCTYFQGNFSKHHPTCKNRPGKSIPFLSCIECGHPMNAHLPVKGFPIHRQKVWKFMKSKQITDKDIQAKHFTVSFRITAQHHQHQIMLDYIQLLEKAGFQVYSHRLMSKWSFEMAMLRTQLLQSKEDPGVLQAALKLTQCIESLGKWSKIQEIGQQFQSQHTILRKVFNNIKKKISSQIKQQDSVLVILIQTSQSKIHFDQHKKLMIHLASYCANLKFLHIVNSKLQCVLLAQHCFPQEFTLSSRMFLLPNCNSQQPFYKFRDFLDYNDYTVVFENIKNMKRINFQSVFSCLPYHQQSYILGTQIVNQTISKLRFVYATKPGPAQLNHFGILPPYLQISKTQNQNEVLRQLYPDYCLGQRAMIILKPFLIGSGLQEIITNLLRLNKFIVIQRIKGRLSLEHANYLATLQHISDDCIQNYIEFMTSGVVQIILVSKRSALYEAHSLLNSCPFGLADINPKFLKQKPVIELQRGKDIYKQQLQFSSCVETKNVFRGAGSLLNMQECLFNPGFEMKTKFIENCRTGQFMKIPGQESYENELKATQKQKQQILWQLRGDLFNYLLFNSKSDKTTQELVSLFMPECTLFQSTVVLIKPNYVHLIQEVINSLLTLRYHIIFQKSVQLSKQFAKELIKSLEKIKLSGQEINQISDLFSGQKVIFLCISKTSAKKQILSLLSNFSFVSQSTIIQPNECEQMLKEILIPVWNNQEQFLKIFNKYLSNLEEAVQLLTGEGGAMIAQQEQHQLLQYFVGSYFGVKPDAQANTTLGKLDYYTTDESLAKYQSWYYATMSNIHSSYIPLLFQYRTFGAQTLVLQSGGGQPFMTCIVNQYIEQKKHLNVQSQQYSDKKKKKQRSLVLYLWSKKLLQTIEDLSVLTATSKQIPVQLDGWGYLTFKNNQHRGVFTKTECIERQKTFLNEILIKYKNNRYIVVNCKRMLESRLLNERYQLQNRRLLPGFGQLGLQASLRIVQKINANKLRLQDKFEMLDPDSEKIKDNPQLMTLYLYRVEPYIGTKYQLLATTLIFFERWGKEAVQYRQVFNQIYDHMKNSVKKYQDCEFIQYQIYLQSLKLLIKGQLGEDDLKNYPNFRKVRTVMDIEDQNLGKNRKFLQQKQYFKGLKQHNDDYLQEIKHKYSKFDLKTLEDPMQEHVLNKKDDLLHKQWGTHQNIVNLLRQDKHYQNSGSKGIFVEYQKKLNENEQKIKQKIAEQLEKMGQAKQETILKDKGLDNQLWYKRVKDGIGKSKVDDAIKKQLQKLNKFKESQLNATP